MKRFDFELPDGWGKRQFEGGTFSVLMHDTEEVEVYAEPQQVPRVGIPSGLFFPDDADRLADLLREAASIARKVKID